uniref:Tryptophan synthase beta chain-like PALP domain-containing protein n=1 Tax=Panagrolaimus sp. ES5 TaxID=591445 RepID=A0AC34FF24_9BILA
MEGQGTLAIEIIEQVPDVDAVLVSVGGGGLIGGINQWLHERMPKVQVILVIRNEVEVTHSSGNHGQALAFAAKKFQTQCVVVVPSNAPKAKVQAIEGYGAKIILVEPTMEARTGKCNELSQKEGLQIVEPHDDWDVMEGQGTLAIEIIEQVPDVDAVLVSVGGGGLIGGINQWLYERMSKVQVIGVEPEGKNILESIAAGKRLWTTGTALDTIADGVRVRALGEKCFEVMRQVSHKKNNEDIRFAWKLIWERLKLVVEPSSALPLAAILKYPQDFKDKSIVLILCGGNVDFVDPSLAQ